MPRETLRNDLAERDEVKRRRASLMREQESHRESVLQMLEQVNSQIQNLNTLQEQMPSTSQDLVSSGSPRLINKPPNLPRFSGIDQRTSVHLSNGSSKSLLFDLCVRRWP